MWEGLYAYVLELYKLSPYLYGLFAVAAVVGLGAGLGAGHELLCRRVEERGSP